MNINEINNYKNIIIFRLSNNNNINLDRLNELFDSKYDFNKINKFNKSIEKYIKNDLNIKFNKINSNNSNKLVDKINFLKTLLLGYYSINEFLISKKNNLKKHENDNLIIQLWLFSKNRPKWIKLVDNLYIEVINRYQFDLYTISWHYDLLLKIAKNINKEYNKKLYIINNQSLEKISNFFGQIFIAIRHTEIHYNYLLKLLIKYFVIEELKHFIVIIKLNRKTFPSPKFLNIPKYILN